MNLSELPFVSMGKSSIKHAENIATKPFAAKYFISQGLINYKEGNYKKAVDSFKTVLRMDPDNEECKEHLAKAQAKLDKEKKIYGYKNKTGY